MEDDGRRYRCYPRSASIPCVGWEERDQDNDGGSVKGVEKLSENRSCLDDAEKTA